MIFCPVDKICYDQKIIRKAHSNNHAQLELSPFKNANRFCICLAQLLKLFKMRIGISTKVFTVPLGLTTVFSCPSNAQQHIIEVVWRYRACGCEIVAVKCLSNDRIALYKTLIGLNAKLFSQGPAFRNGQLWHLIYPFIANG